MQTDRTPPSAGDTTTTRKNRRQFSWRFWVVVAIAVLVGAAVSIPKLFPRYFYASQSSCVNNLRQIDGAKQQWALEHHKSGGDVPELSDIAPYLGRGRSSTSYFVCPSGGAGPTFDSCYEIGAVTNLPRCKIRPKEHRLQ